MADQEQNPAPDETPSGIPPRQVLIKKPDAPLTESPTLRRPVLRRPGSEAPGVPVAPEIKPGVPASPLKRETSRIPLPSAVATAEPEAPAGPSSIADLKTVRVKPLSSPQPGSGAPDGLRGPSDVQTQASKSKTSRISLEAALGALPDAGQAPAGPKTIRLKRPAELASPKATSPLPLAVPLSSGSTGPVVPVAVPVGASAASQTARLPTSKLATARISEVEADAGDSGASLTRRKTIKVRRPTSAATPVVTVRAGGGAPGEAPEADDAHPWVAPPGSVPVVVVDRAHWFFVVSAVASILLVFALIGVLASQAWGPNESLTEFSSWLKGPDMPWPGSYVAR